MDGARCSDLWLIATLTFPWSGYLHICHSARQLTGISPCHISLKAFWFDLKILKSIHLLCKKTLVLSAGSVPCCSVVEMPLQTKVSSSSLILCFKSMTGDDPRIVDEIISVTVSARAWASGDLCRLSPDCYFVPSVTLLTALSSSAAFFPAAPAARKLQRGRPFTSHAVSQGKWRTAGLHS